jgi:hypothetical protein
VDPVDIVFDERGGMFVVETIGYNRPADAKPRSRIVRLEDRDAETNDAIMMKSVAGQETLLRSELESCEPLGLSLMPAGLEGALNHQQMADLIAYLRSNADEVSGGVFPQALIYVQAPLAHARGYG